MINNGIKLLLLINLLVLSQITQADPIKFEFSVGSFSNEDGSFGEITGVFIGEDLNNDGYISSYNAAAGYQGNFDSNPFIGRNEVTFASYQFSGDFTAVLGVIGNPEVNTTSHEDSHSIAPGLPNESVDDFFALNYKIGSGLLGDDINEGLFMGSSNSGFSFAQGSFLPLPGEFFYELFLIDDLPFDADGASLTAQLLYQKDVAPPCNGISACGVMHSVLFDFVNGVSSGGEIFTSEFVSVSRVSTPAISALFALALVLVLAQKTPTPKRYRQ